VIAAVAAGSLALAGFGVDSLIEIVASTVVVWQLRGQTGAGRERRALRVIAVAFVLLALYIAVQAAIRFSSQARPGHSLSGIVWLALTVVAMLALAAGKRRTGLRLGNRVLLTETRATTIDGALAAAVLLGVVLNAAAGRWWADPGSALVILVYGLREARHAVGAAGEYVAIGILGCCASRRCS
jgi:divalent metal cation (Fe/Co/Zn/Cd) transporter